MTTDPRAGLAPCLSTGPVRYRCGQDEKCEHAVAPFDTRWVITMGHAGYNSPANNRAGYATRASALAAVKHYATTTIAPFRELRPR
jgi:hypothetical protein